MHRVRRTLHFSFFVSLALLLCFSSSIARALDDKTLDRYAANGIMFYDPNGGDRCPKGGSVSGDKITYIGDSLSNQVYDSMKNVFSGIDGDSKTYDGTTYNLIMDSKQFSGVSSGPNHDGITIATKLTENKDMRKYLIFALGTNSPGGVTESIIGNLASAVGSDTRVMLVTNFGTHDDADGYERNNEAMVKYASSNSNFDVADWYTVAQSDPEKYIDDSDGLGVHLTNDGKTAFVDTIKDAIGKAWGGSSGSGGGSTGNNKNYAGDQVFSDSEMSTIEENKSTYEAAAQKYGFKWQILAVIHRRENSLKMSNDSNGQGVYQLYSYTHDADGSLNSNAFYPAGAISQEEFARQTDIAASIIVDMANEVGADLNTDDGVKKMLFRYNGMAKQYKDKALAMGFSEEEAARGEGSPYVMNRYDARRDPTSDQMDPNWPGLFTADFHYDDNATNNEFGTFTMYAAIGGSGGGVCDDGDRSKFIQTILSYAWPEYHEPPYLDRKPEYVEAVNARMANGLFVGSSSGVNGIDCGGFVSTAITDSGIDPDYNTPYNGGIGSGQLPYLKDHPDKWELVNADWHTAIPDESVLTPGDVAFSGCDSEYHGCQHTYMYVGEVEGFQYHIASASFSEYGNDRSPMAGVEAIISNSAGPIIWMHRK